MARGARPPAVALSGGAGLERPVPPPPPRVAVDLRALVPEPSGIGVYTRSLLLALAARGGLRYLGVAHRPPRGAAELERAGVVLEHQPAPRGVLWQQLRLPRRLRRGDVDLLWSPLMTLPLRCPVPAVVTVHDLTTLLLPHVHRLKVRWSILPFLRPTLESARRIVTLSRATAGDLARHFPQCAGKVSVVHPGIDPEFRPGPAEEIAATRAELGAPEGYLFFAGTLEPRKNLDLLLDAWEMLGAAADDPPPPLVLAGPYGWRSRRLLSRLQRLAGRGVVYLGHVERARLVRLMQAARLFVYPSLYEGFGLPPAEAMACGVPAVVADTSSLPEVVGDAGVVVDPDDAGGLAAAIAALLGDAEREADLRTRSRMRAARFTWERAAAEMEAVFLETLAASV